MATHARGGLILWLASVLLAGSAAANPVGGTIIGSWTNPLLSGNLLRATGQTEFFDNTLTAQYSINNSSDGITGSALVWGANTTPQPFSVLTFFGATIAGTPPNTPVKLGTLTFLNGSSSLNSLIFGAQLVLSVKNDPSVTPLVAG